MIETIYSNPELYHSGVKGQKWGRRRYQNPDGTWTEEGKRRRRIGDDGYDERDDRPKKKFSAGKAAAIGVGLVGAGLMAREISRHPWQTLDAVNKGSYNVLSKAGDYFKKKAVGVGDAMCDAAMVSIGTIAVSKLASKLGEKDNQSEAEKATNKILLDMGTAGINSFTGTKGRNNSNSKDRRPPTKDEGKRISELIGPPRQKHIDRSGPEYQALFKDKDGNSRNADERATIKSLASAGYGIDQIEEYLNLDHPPF